MSSRNEIYELSYQCQYLSNWAPTPPQTYINSNLLWVNLKESDSRSNVLYSSSRFLCPYNIHTLSSKQVVRILKLIRYKLLPWSPTKFLQQIYKEMCSSKRGELTIRSWELKVYFQALMFCLTALFQAQLSIILSTAGYVKSYWTSVMPMILPK